MKLKKNIYIFSYIIYIMIICTLNMFSVTDVLSPRLNLPLTENPIYFFILDFLILYIIMRKVKKEPYILQKRVIEYFTSINNLFLFIALIFSGSFLMIIINMITNIVLVYMLRPLIADPSYNGVEEHFSKYHYSNNKSYNSIEEVKEEYKPLKKEIESELPGLEVEIKDKQQDNIRKIRNKSLPVIVITLIILGFVCSVVEVLKTFERAEYHYYDVTINEEKIKISYEEEYYNVVIPYVYKQNEYKSFQSDEETKSEIEYKDKFILKLTEYACYNNDKGNNVKVSCGHNALSETKKEIDLINNSMLIAYENEVIYNGEYIEDITKYIEKTGIYTFKITNKRDKLTSVINFSFNVKEKIVEE